MPQPLPKALLLFVLWTAASHSSAQDKKAIFYAVHEQTMLRAKGKIRAVQVQEERSEAECQRSLNEFRKMDPLPDIEGPPVVQCYKNSLPKDLAPIHEQLPVPSAFHVRVESGNAQRLLAGGEIVTHNLFFYTFDPGSPSEVCERLSKSFRSLWVQVTCTPPRAA